MRRKRDQKASEAPRRRPARQRFRGGSKSVGASLGSRECGADWLPRGSSDVNCLPLAARLTIDGRRSNETMAQTNAIMSEAIEQERESYRSHGYVLLKQLFPPLVLAMFRGRLQQALNLSGSRDFVRGNNLLTKPAIEVYSLEYPPMSAFHWGLTPRVTQVAGCELMPSYAYFRIYQQGDVCRVHSDRPACEHSLSLTVELGDNIPWALSMEKRRLEQPLTDVDPDF